MLVMFAATFAIREYVFAYQRWELRPGWFNVSRVGATMLYSAMVMRGNRRSNWYSDSSGCESQGV